MSGKLRPYQAAIRAHGNGTEQVPIFGLMLLALTVANNSSQMILMILVIAFTVARLLHAAGLLFQIKLSGMAGAGLTYLSQFSAVLFLCFTLIQ